MTISVGITTPISGKLSGCTEKFSGPECCIIPMQRNNPLPDPSISVRIPAGVTTVIVGAHYKVHAYGGKEFEVALPR